MIRLLALMENKHSALRIAVLSWGYLDAILINHNILQKYHSTLFIMCTGSGLINKLVPLVEIRTSLSAE